MFIRDFSVILKRLIDDPKTETRAIPILPVHPIFILLFLA